MADTRLAAALARVEDAATRLEGVALAVPAPDEPAPIADDGLAERHRRLQAATAAALARLDRLIGGAG